MFALLLAAHLAGGSGASWPPPVRVRDAKTAIRLAEIACPIVKSGHGHAWLRHGVWHVRGLFDDASAYKVRIAARDGRRLAPCEITPPLIPPDVILPAAARKP